MAIILLGVGCVQSFYNEIGASFAVLVFCVFQRLVLRLSCAAHKGLIEETRLCLWEYEETHVCDCGCMKPGRNI